MRNPKVTIIMRSKNSDWVIASALASLFSQNYKDFELLVVDSGSTDNTLEIVKQYPCRLVEIEATAYYPGKVLNEAIELTNSELIVFLNSDSVMLSPNSLGNLLKRFEDPNISAVFGRQAPRPEADTWVLRDYELSFPDSGEAPSWITMSLPLAGFRRSAWDRHPFYTDAWASEDTEWGLWARKNGYNVAYEPSALTMHSHNYTLKEIYGRRFVEGEADAFIYGEKKSAVVMLLHYTKLVASDTLYHLKKGDLANIPKIFSRRFVYFWAYFKGLKLGFRRFNEGNQDNSTGQMVVLKSQ